MKLYIIKIGGKVLDDPGMLRTLLDDFSRISGAKIMVHGGGKKADEISAKMGLVPQMIEGRRLTDAATLEVVTMVYAGLLNKQVVAQLQGFGCKAIGLSGADGNVLQAQKRPVKDIDYGFAGDLFYSSVNTELLEMLLKNGLSPILCPITHDKKGQLLNTNADTIASIVATSLAGLFEVHLIYCFEHGGVLEDPENAATVIPQITQKEYRQLKESGIVKNGMIPKLDNAFQAIAQGVASVRITRADALLNNKGTLLINS